MVEGVEGKVNLLLFDLLFLCDYCVDDFFSKDMTLARIYTHIIKHILWFGFFIDVEFYLHEYCRFDVTIFLLHKIKL